MKIGRFHSRGFTLLEIAVVLVIVGLIAAGSALLISSQIESARTKSVMTQISDLTSAIADFKYRFKFMPGDFPVSTAASEIAGVSAACKIGGANAGDGNGAISASESNCVQEHLSGAGLIKSSSIGLATDFGGIHVISNAASTVGAGTNPLPASTINVIELLTLPCSVALAVDTALDDGNLATGKIRASVASCTPKGSNDPVPALARGL